MVSRFEKLTTKLRIAVVLLSAVLVTLCFAPFSLSFLVVVAWVPLLAALTGASVKVATRLGFLHGLCVYGATMGWLVHVFPSNSWVVVPLVVVLALFTAVVGFGYALAYKHWGIGWRLVSFGVAWWLGVEFYRSELFLLKFSWMTPGMGLGPHVLGSVLGVYGVGALVILGGMFMLFCLRWWIGAALLVGLYLTSFVKLQPESDESIRVLALQAEFVGLDRYEELIDSCEDEVDVILFPEYAVETDVEVLTGVLERLKRIAKERDAVLILGAKTLISQSADHYNSAITLNADGVLGRHFKNNPVHFFNDGEKGVSAEAVSAPFGKVGTPICFDNDYEYVVRRMVNSGAEVFLVPSLDARHWGEREHVMHAEVFRHRAVESGRWFCIAAGSGKTQMIDPNGTVVDSIPLMDEGVLVADVYLSNAPTLYQKSGWIVPWVAMFASFVSLGWISARVWVKRRE